MKQITSQDLLSKEIKKKALEEGFDLVGIARIPGSNRLELRNKSLERWLEAGHQADMNWMAAPRRKEIKALLDGVQSVLAVGLNYYVRTKKDPNSLLIARYAWGRDYHKVIEKRLKRIGLWLTEQRPNTKWKICVDSAPLLDKAWAEEAGLGWIGKNSNLINQYHGSWFLIGHLLSTEKLTADKSSKPLCGKCKACIEACPTKAITEPFVIDSRRCIAYHTIENRNSELPLEITKHLGRWVAGCDICQDICPWNQKSLRSSIDPELQPKQWILNLTKAKALRWSQDTWDEKLKGSALRRIKPWMWRRNAAATKSTSSTNIQTMNNEHD